MKKSFVFLLPAIVLALAGCSQHARVTTIAVDPNFIPKPAMNDTAPVEKIVRTDAEWKKLLTTEQYAVLRGKGTEAAFCGAFWNNHDAGTYYCAACGLDLFAAGTKFESGTGWPSFFEPVAKNRIIRHEDNSYGMKRVEVVCARCESHLGNVFDDGPPPTGERFCMNSVSLKFIPAAKK
jgi:methionine-R-sulfoxide reductase